MTPSSSLTPSIPTILVCMGVHVCSEARGQAQPLPLGHHPSVLFFTQALCLVWCSPRGPGWLANERQRPTGLSVSQHWDLRHTMTPSLFMWVMGIELRS